MQEFDIDDNDPFSDFGHSFDNIKTAEQIILAEKDSSIWTFQKLISEYVQDGTSLDSKSLMELEKLYYEIYVDKKTESKIPRTDFERYLSIYFMKILVEEKLAKWKVVKNPFSESNFNLAIEFDDHNWTTGGFATELYENEKAHGRKYLSEQLEEYLGGQNTKHNNG
jgi:hypothetical protein